MLLLLQLLLLLHLFKLKIEVLRKKSAFGKTAKSPLMLHAGGSVQRPHTGPAHATQVLKLGIVLVPSSFLRVISLVG